MTSGELSSADYEGDAKAVDSMIGGMHKVVATVKDADEERRPKSASSAASAAPATSSGEAERLHRRLSSALSASSAAGKLSEDLSEFSEAELGASGALWHCFDALALGALVRGMRCRPSADSSAQF
jgi:hypothetical protein